jgi:hypothetical protein
MAKKTTKSAKPKPTTAAPNLFANAAKAAASAPKKTSGTVIALPKELDTEGKLIGDSKLLNEAVSNAIEAAAEEKTAKTKGTLAKTKLMGFAQQEVVKLYAKLGVPPTTPVSVVNHNGESVTYVMADKSQQNPISPEQIAMLRELLGDEGAAQVVDERTTFFFDNATMGEKAANDEKTVFDIVCEHVNATIATDPRLSDEQKANLLKSTVKSFLKPNTLNRIAELCGSNAAKIGQFYEAAGTACVRSIKV